ncbi:Rho-binding antiterminator [Gallaecimonas pentaromativorans]|uniref:Rof transcriptional antiterminator n=1 Tax=Gallaecimonas pentaromativorans TaxID=584787 RepID=A0A3N1PF09_9GAMM|nr:Rho-binding antiterminator [Gallaecimonas pentaromativorans]MED5524282.1 Rho-binding antiterminator [Pseudomonadota bacterium]ROQ30042.1 Rof transcriptional antiterminator [Gallaecimonas pentaromativorans]
MKPPYQPIRCDLYDYLEIACLFGYRLQVELASGQTFEAKALTTRVQGGEEFLTLQNGEATREYRLDAITAITPLDSGARFGRVVLAP